LSCIIDAEEERDVAVIDIPNAFIQTREKDMAIIKMRGVLVDILVEISPDAYKSYATTDKKGVRQLLVQYQNALVYGTMVASLLYTIASSPRVWRKSGSRSTRTIHGTVACREQNDRREADDDMLPCG
jgi:hypothetical protein